MSTYKTLRIKIEPNECERLRQAGYKLCITKYTNNTIDVIWMAPETFFEWTARSWEVFGISKFTPGDLVKPDTNTVIVLFGQTVILDKDGVLHRSTSLPNYESGEFYIQNDYRDGPMCIGINALYGGDIIQLSSPSYVTQTPLIIGGDPLSIRPFEKVAVGFMKNATAGTMFVDDTMTGKVEFDMSTEYLMHMGAIYSVAPDNEKGQWIAWTLC